MNDGRNDDGNDDDDDDHGYQNKNDYDLEKQEGCEALMSLT